ncbi:hypothetical protein [Ideonella livida]|uniref:Uncharacterized protein n=1 Tax=Ideonella livida TaxID=2707176 RepID=A0A7C9PIX5_9BURK|nr:hypothetical protein [Ideonella livida]NDY92948.1 hypothetical protein [Ideonella livida]
MNTVSALTPVVAPVRALPERPRATAQEGDGDLARSLDQQARDEVDRQARALQQLAQRVEFAQRNVALVQGGLDLERSPAEHQSATASYAAAALMDQAMQARRTTLLSVA